MNGRRSGRRTLVLLAAVAVVAAACTPESDVTSDSAVEIDGTDAPGPTASSTPPVTSPTSAGLPTLTTPDPDTVTGTLDNGLRYLIRDNDNPGGKAELRLAVDAGSVLEDERQLGGAHFVEHMLFNGTEQFPKNELIDVLRSFGAGFGADINARTSYDETVYELTVPNDDDIVETGLDILEEWLSFATIDPGDVEDERGIVLDEWRSRSQTSNGRVFDEFASFHLAGSGYDGRSPIGGREAIESITADDLRRFYDDWYRPDLASVIVVGDIDPDEVEAWIVDRFADATSRGDSPARADVFVEPATATRVEVVGDPELAEGFVGVALPMSADPVVPESAEVDEQRSILEGLAFQMIATRLDNEALRGDAPFERAGASSASFVRGLDAPEITVDVSGDGADASVQAVADEFERVERFGFTQSELDRVVGSSRSSAEQDFESRGSRQDVSYANEYVRHVLEDEWYVTADQEFAFVDAVLDAATPESVADVFSDRADEAGVHAFIAVPDDELEMVGTAEELAVAIDGAADRELEPPVAEEALGDVLMARPDPVEEVSEGRLATDPFTDALDPVVLEFPNGAQVSLNTTTIVERQVFFEARSPGGLAAVADADVPDAAALGDVIGDSGVGEFDRVALDAFLDDKSVSLSPSVDPFTDGMFGTAATDDLEVLFQLVHLLMTDARADEAAVDRYVDDQLPFAQDPSIDAGYAEFDALLNARYDEPRFLLPTPETLATVDAAAIDRVAGERFGDAGDWSFSFSGDYDVDDAIELARAYVGSLPSTGTADPLNFDEPPPPDGAVVAEAQAGQGDTANVSFLYTASASSARRDDILARVVREVISNRLTDFIREGLGDSYSPFAAVDLGGGEKPAVETYISVSTAPELADEVSVAVLEQLAALRAEGPSEQDFTNASVTVAEQLDFINNAQINDEVLAVLVDPGGNASFDEFTTQPLLIQTITADDVRGAIEAWTSSTDYIEVRVTPIG
jgi:zinc protease